MKIAASELAALPSDEHKPRQGISFKPQIISLEVFCIEYRNKDNYYYNRKMQRTNL